MTSLIQPRYGSRTGLRRRDRLHASQRVGVHFKWLELYNTQSEAFVVPHLLDPSQVLLPSLHLLKRFHSAIYIPSSRPQ